MRMDVVDSATSAVHCEICQWNQWKSIAKRIAKKQDNAPTHPMAFRAAVKIYYNSICKFSVVVIEVLFVTEVKEKKTSIDEQERKSRNGLCNWALKWHSLNKSLSVIKTSALSMLNAVVIVVSQRNPSANHANGMRALVPNHQLCLATRGRIAPLPKNLWTEPNSW